MSNLIALSRFLPATIASVVLVVLIWPFELLLGIVFFPIKAMFQPHQLVENDYAGWPCNTLHTIQAIWMWAKLDPDPRDANRGVFNFLGNLL